MWNPDITLARAASLGKFDSGRILIRERETAAARRRSTATGKLTDQFGYSLPPSLSHSLDLDLCAVKIRSMAFLVDTSLARPAAH